jgi:uncharacterized protein with PQ loop repeat
VKIHYRDEKQMKKNLKIISIIALMINYFILFGIMYLVSDIEFAMDMGYDVTPRPITFFAWISVIITAVIFLMIIISNSRNTNTPEVKNQISTKKFCSDCGSEMESSKKFCSNCGGKVE